MEARVVVVVEAWVVVVVVVVEAWVVVVVEARRPTEG